MRREDRDDALYRFRGIQGMKGGHDEVACFSRHQCRLYCFVITHFPNQDDVGVLAECSAQGGLKADRVNINFALDDE